MKQRLRTATLATTLLLALGGLTARAQDPGIDPAVREQFAIYRAFLDGWLGKGKSKLYVADKADPVSQEDGDALARCAGEHQWTDSTRADDSIQQLGTLPYIRLVDASKFQVADPLDPIRRGMSVEAAVKAAFDHALMTLSAIRFDERHQTAAFTYAFTCGSLCGNGAPIVFRKVAGQWKQSKKSCGGWMS